VEPAVSQIPKQVPADNATIQSIQAYPKGKAIVTGKITDKKGRLPIPFATVNIKGTKTAVLSNADGTFTIRDIKTGKVTLIISSVGYASKEIVADAAEINSGSININLQAASAALSEVVVTGYTASAKRSLTLAMGVIREQDLTSTISGNVLGVSIGSDGQPGNMQQIMLRGISSFGDQKPLYVIDGILYDNIPANITPDMIADVMVLKPAEAVGIYGEKAADGAVVIATKSKNARSQFRDYAFWKPEFFTDENGDASFIAEYPDNITGWQTYVLGMDKKRRMGKAVTYVKSFKPLSATLSMPQFLISGDSVQLVGKLFNYTHDSYSVVSSFSAYQHQYPSVEATLESNASKIEKSVCCSRPTR
jgi:hypothetical protein